MRLVSYLHDGMARYGLAASQPASDRIAIVAAQRCWPQAPATITEFIQAWSDDLQLRRSCERAMEELRDEAVPVHKLLPCVPRPGKIVCLGVNYAAHAAEGGNKVADYPTLFLRCSTSLVAHGGQIPIPPASDKLDYEAELAVVIGKRLRDADESTALAGVFGYSCFNDATFRDYQKRTTQWTIGKNFDATGGFGPWIVTADELPAGCEGLRICSRLNGQTMQASDTSRMVFKVAQTLSLLSQCMTLEPGDVVAMGTPEGVGYARQPPVWMRPGDVIEIEVERVGVLRNTVAAMDAAPPGAETS